MKKSILALAMLVSVSAFARGGGDGVSGGLPINTTAALVNEATEHSLRQFLRTEPTAANQVTGISAAMSQPDGTTMVTINLGGARVVSFICVPFDDFSRGGTIVKKEMGCRPN